MAARTVQQQRTRKRRSGGAHGPVVDRGEVGRIVIDGQELIFPIRRSRRRTIGLTIEPVTGLRITAPHRSSMAEIIDVVREKERWIVITMAKLAATVAARPVRRYCDGESFLFRGMPYALEIRHGAVPPPVAAPSPAITSKGQFLFGFETPAPIVSDSATPQEVWTEGNRLIVNLPTSTPNNDVGAIWAALRRFYILTAEAEIPERVQLYAAMIGRPVRRIVISDAQHRWGSCTSRSTIRMSWRLMMAPPDLLDYVAAHEVCHLIHQHHRPSFWRAVEKLVPDWRDRRQQLGQRGAEYELLEPV